MQKNTISAGLIAMAGLAFPSTGWAQTCNDAANTAFGIASTIAGFVPGGEAFDIAVLIGSSLASAECEGSQITMLEVVEEIERITNNKVSENNISQLEIQTRGFLLEFRNTFTDFEIWLEQGNLEDQDQRNRLADKFEDLAFDAGRIEGLAEGQRFPVIPIFMQLSSIKLGAFLQAQELLADNEKERLQEKIDEARAASAVLLEDIETGFSKGLTLKRFAKTDTGARGTRLAEGTVEDEAGTLYRKKRTCSKIIPTNCDSSWRGFLRNIFAESREAFVKAREDRMNVAQKDYLAFKNGIGASTIPVAKLALGAHSSSSSRFPCVVVDEEGSVRTERCGNLSDTEDTKHHWSVLSTGQLYHLDTGKCLQPSVNDSVGVEVSACLTEDASSQSWGFHPGGWIVYLGEDDQNRCLGSRSRISESSRRLGKTIALEDENAELHLTTCEFSRVGFGEATSLIDTALRLHSNAGGLSSEAPERYYEEELLSTQVFHVDPIQ